MVLAGRPAAAGEATVSRTDTAAIVARPPGTSRILVALAVLSWSDGSGSRLRATEGTREGFCNAWSTRILCTRTKDAPHLRPFKRICTSPDGDVARSFVAQLTYRSTDTEMRRPDVWF